MFKIDCLSLFGQSILSSTEGDIDNCLRFAMAFIVKSKNKQQSLFSTVQNFNFVNKKEKNVGVRQSQQTQTNDQTFKLNQGEQLSEVTTLKQALKSNALKWNLDRQINAKVERIKSIFPLAGWLDLNDS